MVTETRSATEVWRDRYELVRPMLAGLSPASISKRRLVDDAIAREVAHALLPGYAQLVRASQLAFDHLPEAVRSDARYQEMQGRLDSMLQALIRQHEYVPGGKR